MSGTPQKVKLKSGKGARIILICVGILFLFIAMCGTCKDKKSSNANPPTAKTTRAYTPGSTRLLYQFYQNNNVVKLEVNGGRLFLYPKGGKIKVCPPSGKCYIDTPGIDILNSLEAPGVWTITPAEPSATGVEARIEGR